MLRSFAIAGLLLFCTTHLSANELSAREAFFSNDVLYSAEADVGQMRAAELSAFRDLLAECVDSLSVDAMVQHRCNVERTRYSLQFRQERPLDRLLDAVGSMTSLLQKNQAMGRESEPGLASRVSAIHHALSGAARLAFKNLAQPSQIELSQSSTR
jgi:hypothetical protein